MAPSFCMCPLAPDLIVSLFLCFFVILSCSFSLFGAPCFVHLRLLPCPVPSILFNNKKDVPTSSLGPLETGLGSPGLDLAVRSFVDIQRPLAVRKRLGMEKEQLSANSVTPKVVSDPLGVSNKKLEKASLMRSPSDYFPLIRRGVSSMTGGTSTNQPEVMTGWKVEVTNRKEREEALRYVACFTISDSI